MGASMTTPNPSPEALKLLGQLRGLSPLLYCEHRQSDDIMVCRDCAVKAIDKALDAFAAARVATLEAELAEARRRGDCAVEQNHISFQIHDQDSARVSGLIEQRDALAVRLRVIRSALLMLSRWGPVDCWCENHEPHSPGCLAARAALAATEGSK